MVSNDNKTVLNDDRTALDWMKNFSGNELLKKSWDSLNDYYIKCREELKSMSDLKFYNNGAGSRPKTIKFVKEKLGFDIDGNENLKTKDNDLRMGIFNNKCLHRYGIIERRKTNSIYEGELENNIFNFFITKINHD